MIIILFLFDYCCQALNSRNGTFNLLVIDNAKLDGAHKPPLGGLQIPRTVLYFSYKAYANFFGLEVVAAASFLFVLRLI